MGAVHEEWLSSPGERNIVLLPKMAKGEEQHKRNTASAAGRTSPLTEGSEEDHGKHGLRKTRTKESS